MKRKKLFIVLSCGLLFTPPLYNPAIISAKENAVSQQDIIARDKMILEESLSLSELLIDTNSLEENLLNFIDQIILKTDSINKFLLELSQEDNYTVSIKKGNQLIVAEVIDNKEVYKIESMKDNNKLEIIIEDQLKDSHYSIEITYMYLSDDKNISQLEANLVSNESSSNEQSNGSEEEEQEDLENSPDKEKDSDSETNDDSDKDETIDHSIDSMEESKEDKGVKEVKEVKDKGDIGKVLSDQSMSQDKFKVMPFLLTKRTAVGGIYTTQKDDTFNLIAKDFSLSIPQLKGYNPGFSNINSLKVGDKLAVSREGLESRLSAAEKARMYKPSVSVFNSASQFFEYLVPIAKELSNLPNEESLYVSLMLAQAALESGYGKSGLSSPPYHNLTGIKGDHNGEYVKMWTNEYDSTYDVYYSVLANFKKYPSYYESLKSNADKMRNGTYWDNLIYSGVWVKNAPTYKDAVQAIHVSPYATDPNYGNKLNNIIDLYKLYNYDYDTILETRNVNYNAIVKYGNKGIYTEPKGIRDARLVTSYIFNGKDVKVTKESKTSKGTFLQITLLETGKVAGWIHSSDIDIYPTILTTKSVEYWANVKKTNSGIYTLPKGMYKSRLVTNYVYNNKDVMILQESTTAHGKFLKLAKANTKEVIGWIKEDSVSVYPTIGNRQRVNYISTVQNKNSGIYTRPQEMPGTILVTSYVYNNKQVKAIEELKTTTTIYVKIANRSSNKVIGWIKKGELNSETISQSNRVVSLSGRIKVPNEGIYTLPKGTKNAILVTSYVYNNKDVKLVEESTTNNGIYYKIIHVNGGKTIGWINKDDIQLH